MKKILYIILVLVGVVSCQNNYPEPAHKVPSYALEDSLNAGWTMLSIEDVKLLNPSAMPKQIVDKYLVKGIVTADDESGNIYKSIYLQDNTAAICLALDQVNLYNTMPRGQEVIIELNGLWVGTYAGYHQLGDSTTHEKYGFQMGRWDWNKEYFDQHFFPIGVPDTTNLPQPTPIYSKDNLGPKDYCTLVVLKNVIFPDADGDLTWSESEETINVKVQFEAGGSDYINVRTSGYSNFYADKVPTGKCDVVGIISYYEFSSEPYQLYIRDREDIIKLD
ncbi:MAG: hypothetical protein IJY67_03400 [Paludibacteraceae bacterium]|nr:hypothetical protein [Paludibacteraceae bacterium]